MLPLDTKRHHKIPPDAQRYTAQERPHDTATTDGTGPEAPQKSAEGQAHHDQRDRVGSRSLPGTNRQRRTELTKYISVEV